MTAGLPLNNPAPAPDRDGRFTAAETAGFRGDAVPRHRCGGRGPGRRRGPRPRTVRRRRRRIRPHPRCGAPARPGWNIIRARAWIFLPNGEDIQAHAPENPTPVAKLNAGTFCAEVSPACSAAIDAIVHQIARRANAAALSRPRRPRRRGCRRGSARPDRAACAAVSRSNRCPAAPPPAPAGPPCRRAWRSRRPSRSR